MKNKLSIVLAVLLIITVATFSFTACKNGQSSETPQSSANATSVASVTSAGTANSSSAQKPASSTPTAISVADNTSASSVVSAADSTAASTDNSTASSAATSAIASSDNSSVGGGQSAEKPAVNQLIKEYLDAVVETTGQSPLSYIPETMRPDYAQNFVTEAQVSYDLTDFVNLGNIKYGGFGEQWNMVIDNMVQSERFYNYLGIGETVLAASVTLMDGYLDSADEEVSGHEEETDKFKAVLNYTGEELRYTVTYKTELTIPFFGKVEPIIDMTLNVETNVKTVLVILTTNNAMRYTITDNSYEFGIEYGVNAANRSAYCQLNRSESGVDGHIYEYITVKDKDAVKSCADFYINDTYVSVVGNKADGMLGFTGYINELYNVNQGKLLGYEVQETASIAGISGTYNTLWFNLSDISGITSIKLTDKTDGNNSSLSTADVYLNGGDKLFTPTYNKKLGIKTSRKYDIELRTQYFYGTNEEGELVEYKTKVPMMFIQQDNDKDSNFSDYPSDMLNDNGITSTVTLSKAYLDKIMADYANLIEIFKTNKELVDSVTIKSYIGA